MVPVTNSVDAHTESQSPQGSDPRSDNDDDISLHPASLGTIPPWIDNTESSLDISTHNLEKGINNAIPSQGSSPHVENALARPVVVDAPKVQYGSLESPNAGSAPSSLSDSQIIEQENEIEIQLVEKLARLWKRKKNLQSLALNPSSSNSLEVSAIVEDAVGREKEDTIILAVVVEVKEAPRMNMESKQHGGSDKGGDADDDTLEFKVVGKTPRGHRQL
jgi:hypothetical protein